jgi:hypothetical protein
VSLPKQALPEVGKFDGIKFKLYGHEEHRIPHVAVEYAEFEGSMDLDGVLLAGRLPPKILRKARVWVVAHRAELLEGWEALRRGELPPYIGKKVLMGVREFTSLGDHVAIIGFNDGSRWVCDLYPLVASTYKDLEDPQEFDKGVVKQGVIAWGWRDYSPESIADYVREHGEPLLVNVDES